MSSSQKHIHLSKQELQLYITSEQQLSKAHIEQIELELQVCEQCSEMYIQLLDNIEFQIEPVLTENRFEHIQQSIEQHEKRIVLLPAKKKWYEYAVVHVVAAASITGLLFVSGLLSVISTSMNAPIEEEATIKLNEEKQNLFNLEEQEWVKYLQNEMLKLKQIQLFEEEK